MGKKTRLLNEDNQMLYNKWVSGIAKKEAPPEVITVADLQNRFRNSQNYQAPKNLPYPLNFLLDFLGNIFVKCAELRRLMGSAVYYPVIKKDVNKVKALHSLNEKMKRIQDIVYSTTEELTILVKVNSVEKREE